jgi:hypothetical protein
MFLQIYELSALRRNTMKKFLMILAACLAAGVVHAAAPFSKSSVDINVSSAATTQLVAGISGEATYVGSLDLFAAGTTSVSLVAGTGSSCGTGTRTLAGPYAFVAQTGIAKGAGNGIILALLQGESLCIVNSAAIQVGGSVSYVQQ